MRNVLITGGAGFIGTHLYRRLLKVGANITIFDNLSEQIHGANYKFKDDKVTFIKGDIRDAEAVSHAVVGQDIIFHLAAETGTGQSMYEISRYIEVNEIGTARLLEAISQLKDKPKKFVLASSRSIYGEGAYLDGENHLVHPESRSSAALEDGNWDFLSGSGHELVPTGTPVDLPPKPASIYAATKLAQEGIVRIACIASGIETSILRFQNVYGEGQSLRNPYTGIISIFYNRMRQGLPVNIYEDGNESRDFVHVSDVVEALLTSGSKITTQDHIVANVGSGIPTSVMELAEIIKKQGDFEVPLKVTGQYRVGDIRHCYANLDCAHHLLSYSPKIALHEGIKRFISWASSEPISQDLSEFALQELSLKGLAKA
jgi:dTDP-L-rhamnose 4-epimerase